MLKNRSKQVWRNVYQIFGHTSRNLLEHNISDHVLQNVIPFRNEEDIKLQLGE